MRELSTPSLFDPSAPVPPPTSAVENVASETAGPARIAKDFVRWCCSFGAEFRNAPDVINLRTWMLKNKLHLSDDEQNELLIEARRLFLKRLEQLVKKDAVAPPLAPTS